MKIGFSAPSSWNPLSWLIEKVTGSKWSHCFIVLDQSFGTDTLIIEESMLGGVKVNVLSEYQTGHKLELYEIKSISLPDQTSLQQYLGEPYGYLDMLGMAIAKIFRLKHNPINKDMVCSQLVLKFLMATPLSNEFKSIDYSRATPEDLYEVIIKSPSFVKVN